MEYNSLVLAYIGDAIYEVLVRKYLIDKNFVKVNDLQKHALNYVSAKNQALFLKELLDNNFFTVSPRDSWMEMSKDSITSH